MTTHIDKELLLKTLLERGDKHTSAMRDAYLDIVDELRAGEYDIKESDNAVQQQDPIDELADLAIASVEQAVDRVRVVEVQPVLQELRTRAQLTREDVDRIEKTAAEFYEAVQASAQKRMFEDVDQSDEARVERDAAMHGESLARRGDYTTRNGGR